MRSKINILGTKINTKS